MLVPVRIAVTIAIVTFGVLVCLAVIAFLFLDALERIESLRSRMPWFARFKKRRESLFVLLCVCIILLIGDSYELVMKEMPETPAPLELTFRGPAAPAIQAMQPSEDAENQKRKAIREQLGKFIAEGTEIRNSLIQKPLDPDGINRYAQWRARVERYLAANLDTSYVERFRTVVYAVTSAVNNITSQIAQLDQFLVEYKD